MIVRRVITLDLMIKCSKNVVDISAYLVSFLSNLKVIASTKKMFKPTLIFLVINAIAVSSFSVNVTRISQNSLEPSRTSEARTISKHFNLLYDLFKMFNSVKPKSNGDAKKSKTKVEVIPFDGLNHDAYNNRRVEKFTTLAELNKQEGILDMNMNSAIADIKDVKKEEPQFWMFDKFTSKYDLIFMTKVLLKIIVFKKIVKFIALVCLLFFLPTINDNSKEEKKDSRNLDVYGKVK